MFGPAEHREYKPATRIPSTVVANMPQVTTFRPIRRRKSTKAPCNPCFGTRPRGLRFCRKPAFHTRGPQDIAPSEPAGDTLSDCRPSDRTVLTSSRSVNAGVLHCQNEKGENKRALTCDCPWEICSLCSLCGPVCVVELD